MSYYVYEHWRPDLGVPFYVGKGKGKRAYVLDGRATKHREVVKVLKGSGLEVEVRVVFMGLPEKEAFLREMERIDFWRSQQVELTNLTDGGDGCWGVKYTEARRQKLSRSLKGKKRTPEQCLNISEGQKRKAPPSQKTRQKLSIAGKNRRLSEEHKAGISAALKNKPKSEEHRASLIEAQKTILRPPRSAEARARMSAAQKKRVLPPEVWDKIKAALSKAHKNRVPSDESRQKMSKSQAGRTHSEGTKQVMRIKALEREARKRAARLEERAIVALSPQ